MSNRDYFGGKTYPKILKTPQPEIINSELNLLNLEVWSNRESVFVLTKFIVKVLRHKYQGFPTAKFIKFIKSQKPNNYDLKLLNEEKETLLSVDFAYGQDEFGYTFLEITRINFRSDLDCSKDKAIDNFKFIMDIIKRIDVVDYFIYKQGSLSLPPYIEIDKVYAVAESILCPRINKIEYFAEIPREDYVVVDASTLIQSLNQVRN